MLWVSWDGTNFGTGSEILPDLSSVDFMQMHSRDECLEIAQN